MWTGWWTHRPGLNTFPSLLFIIKQVANIALKIVTKSSQDVAAEIVNFIPDPLADGILVKPR